MTKNKQQDDSDPLQGLILQVTPGGIEFSFRAQGELGSVHRRELASLLIEAARVGLGLGASGRGNTEYGPLLEPVRSCWRNRARRELELLERDGLELDGQALLELQLEGEAKPMPEELILAALNLWSSPGGYLALGQVLLARGEGARARDIYAELLKQNMNGDLGEGPDFPWRLREGLGAAWESLGADRLALGSLRGAVDIPGAGAGPLVAAFFLALDLGRGEESLRLGTLIDQRFPADSRRLGTCVRSLGKRIQRRRLKRRLLASTGCWTPPRSSVAAFEELLAGSGSTAKICKGLVGQGGIFGELAS